VARRKGAAAVTHDVNGGRTGYRDCGSHASPSPTPNPLQLDLFDCDLALDIEPAVQDRADIDHDLDVDLDVEVDAFDCDVEGRAEIATSKILDIVLAPHWQTRRGLRAQIEPLVLGEFCQLIEETRAKLRYVARP
jgi:hypothetical protein